MSALKKRSSVISESFQKAAPYLNIVYVLFGAVGFFAYLGYLVDQKWDKSPLFIVLGVLSGFALGLYHMFKVIQQMERK